MIHTLLILLAICIITLIDFKNQIIYAEERPLKRGKDNIFIPLDSLLDDIASSQPKKKKTAVSTENILFHPLPEPQAGDWLSMHEEPGQTLKQFLRSDRNNPSGKQNKIYLQPIEKFDKRNGPSLEMLKEFTKKYFSMPVVVLSTAEVDTNEYTSRINPLSGNKQYYAPDILEYLDIILPADAFCILAITMTDLYPDPSWNFVFGLASIKERVGVFSFARYFPAFYGDSTAGKNETNFLLRCCKILGHETGHMFGMLHCISYHCSMNGSNHLGEMDAQPIHLCPVCASKLQRSVGFNLMKRYKRLQQFYRISGLNNEATWMTRRIAQLENENIKVEKGK
jgi:archaemetzincin